MAVDRVVLLISLQQKFTRGDFVWIFQREKKRCCILIAFTLAGRSQLQWSEAPKQRTIRVQNNTQSVPVTVVSSVKCS
jgi:hypothetical protein